MQKHAKSFYLASLFFPKHLFQQVRALYALCRWLDDAVDETPDPQEAIARLDAISEDLLSAKPVMEVNQHYRQQGLPPEYIKDLIQGVKKDRGPVRMMNWEDFIQYCYQVAGAVGLAMYDLMQIANHKARAHAVDLGLAMQITNICRDVKEDAARDRVYLPADLLKQYGLHHEDILNGKSENLSTALPQVIRALLRQADLYYASSEQAFAAIPWRTRGAIIIASRLYRGIGVKLLRQGADPMQGRTYLGSGEKFLVVTGAIFFWMRTAFYKNPEIKHNPELHTGLEPWKGIRGFSS